MGCYDQSRLKLRGFTAYSRENEVKAQNIIDQIKKFGEMTSVSQVTTFHGYLEGVGKIEIEILDNGEADHLRYAVRGRTLDMPQQKTVSSNAEPDIASAISMTKWWKLKD